MIVLDTNVVSALMRSALEPKVIAWLDTQPAESIWTTSVCLFEIQCGLEIMTKGRKQQNLQEAFEQTLLQDLEGRVLDFDTSAAWEAAAITAKLRAAGRTIETRDAQIAGIVVSRRGTLATRNTRHFIDTGALLVNPWD